MPWNRENNIKDTIIWLDDMTHNSIPFYANHDLTPNQMVREFCRLNDIAVDCVT